MSIIVGPFPVMGGGHTVFSGNYLYGLSLGRDKFQTITVSFYTLRVLPTGVLVSV